MPDQYGVGGGTTLIPGGNEEPRKKKKRRPETPAPGPQPREPQQSPGPGGGSQPTNPQAPPQPTYHPPPPAQDPVYHHVLANRIGSFPKHVIQQAPFLVAGLSFSGVDNETLLKVANGLNSAWNWLNQPLTPQVLARLLAMRKGAEPGIATDLPLGTFHATAAREGSEDPEGRRMLAANIGEQTAEMVRRMAGDIREESAARTEQIQAAMEAELQQRISRTPEWANTLGDITGLDWINQTFLQKPFRLLAGYGQDVAERAQNFDPQEAFAQGDVVNRQGLPTGETRDPYWDPVANTLRAGSTLLGEVPAAGAQVGGRALENIPGIGPQLHNVADFALKYPSQLFRWVGEKSMAAGAVVARASGARPNTPQFESIQNITAFLLQWEGGKFIARTSGALREGVGQPREITFPEIGRKELKAAAKEAGLRGVKTPSAQFRESWSNTLLGVRGPSARLHGLYAQAIARLVSLPADKWFTTPGSLGAKFTRQVARINTQYGREASGALIEEFKGMDPRLARDLSTARTPEEVASYMIEKIRKPSEEEIAAKHAELRALDARLKSRELTPAERGEANAEILKVRHWLDNLHPESPIFRVPKKSVFKQVQTNTGGRFVRVLHHIYQPDTFLGIKRLPKGVESYTEFPSGAKVRNIKWTKDIALPSFSRLFDDFRGDGLWIPGAHGAPSDALAVNAEFLSKGLRRLGVPDGRVRSVLTRLANAETRPDFFDVLVRDVSDAIGDSPYIAPDMKQAMVERWTGLAYENMQKSRVSTVSVNPETGRPDIVPVLTHNDRYGHPIPSISQRSQMVARVPMFDLELAIEATSFARNLKRALRRAATTAKTREMSRLEDQLAKASSADERAKIGRLLRRATERTEGKQRFNLRSIGARLPLIPIDTMSAILDTATAIGKPLTLVTRTLGALPFRIQLEQGFRNWAVGYDALVGARGRAFSDAIHDRQVLTAIGSITRDVLEPIGRTSERWEVRRMDEHRGPNPAPMNEEKLARLHEMFEEAASDPELIELVKRGKDGFVEWASGTSGGARNYRKLYEAEFDKSNEVGGMTWEEQTRYWADMKWRELEELAGGAPNAMQIFTKGAWSRRGAHFEDAVRNSVGKLTEAEEYQGLLDERARLNEHIAQAENPSQIKAYQDARFAVAEKIDAFEAKAIDLRQFEVSLSNRKAFMDALDDAHVSGEYTPPWEISVRKEDPLTFESRSRLANAQKWSVFTQNIMYRGLKAATLADIRGTRGSLFYQVWRRNFAELAARYGTKDVQYLKDQAMWRAARETADLHYDLAARSSMHKFLKNLFWFLPAYQEVLTTWMVKIPSRYGQGLGQLYLGNQLSSFVNLLKSEGVITKGPPTKDNPEGEDRILLPWVQHLFGGTDENPTVIGFRPSGLNLIASGLPSIAPAAAIPLGIAARKYGGLYKQISDALTFNGADTSIMPQGINYAWEALTGKPSPFEVFSPDYTKQLHDLAFDDALAMAYYTLGKDGVERPPSKPTSGEFKTDEEFQAALAKWRKDYPTDKAYGDALTQYYRTWLAEAKHIHTGRYFVKMIGATVAPASLFVTSKWRDDWNKFWFKLTKGQPLTEGLSPEQSDEVASWLNAHPNGLAYRVFRNVKGENERPLPFEPQELNDLYYSGAIKTLTPEEFQRRVAVFESNRHYAMLRDQVYAGMTAPEVLLSYRSVHDKLEEINQSQRLWKHLNPDENGEWEAWVRSFGDPNAKSPEQVVAMERLKDTIDGLKSLAPLFTSGAIRDVEWKRVLGKIQGAYSDTGEFGPPRTEVEKGVAWYLDNVVSPYMNQILPLYEKADSYSAAGADAGPIFTQIRHINNTFSSGPIIGPDGLEYPSPEDYFFAHMSPYEQKVRVLHWITEPTGWLTDFQREHAGLGPDPRYGKMFDAIENFQTNTVQKYIDDNKISPSSKWYTAVREWEQDRIVAWTKKKYGAEGQRLWALSQAAPYKRLIASDFGVSNDQWQKIVGWADWATKNITTPWPQTNPDIHYSPEGDTSDTQKYYKTKVFDAIDQLRLKDPGGPLDKLFTNLEYALASGGKAYRRGYDLYDALFFNQFSTRLVPSNPDIYERIGSGLKEQVQATTTGAWSDFHPSKYPVVYDNGRIPLVALVKVGTGQTAYAVNGGYYLRPDAAASFRAMLEAAKKAGITIPLANAYRTFEQQQAIWNDPNVHVKAAPGHSDHGLGLAFDLNGNDPHYQAARDWILAHAHKYGWINASVRDPVWDEGGWSGSDPGHFSFYAGGGTSGGSGASYGLPLSIDKYWIRLARAFTGA